MRPLCSGPCSRLALHQAQDPAARNDARQALWLALAAWVAGEWFRRLAGPPPAQGWPDGQALWRFMDEQRVTSFGCGAAYLINAMKDGLRPRDFAPMPALRALPPVPVAGLIASAFRSAAPVGNAYGRPGAARTAAVTIGARRAASVRTQ